MNTFIESSRDPYKKANDPHGGRDPQVENHCSKSSEPVVVFSLIFSW